MFYAPAYNDFIMYKRYSKIDILKYNVTKNYIKEFNEDLLPRYKKKYKNWNVMRNVLTERLLVKIATMFNKLMIEDLVENNDIFVFPTPGFGYLCIMPHEPPVKNYVNFYTNHKRVNINFIPNKVGQKWVKKKYVIYPNKKWRRRIRERIEIENFKYNFYVNKKV